MKYFEGKEVMRLLEKFKIVSFGKKTTIASKKAIWFLRSKYTSTLSKAKFLVKDKIVEGDLKTRKIAAAGGSIAILMIGLATFLFMHSGKKNQITPLTNLLKINTIAGEVGNLEGTVAQTSRMDREEKTAMDERLVVLGKKLSVLAKRNGQKQQKELVELKKILQSRSVGLNQKIQVLNKEVKAIKKKLTPKSMLGTDALPFKVVSVDPWNGKPFAEISQKSNSTMISYVGLYQVSGGWKVVDISAPEQTVTFANKSGQLVHVAVGQF